MSLGARVLALVALGAITAAVAESVAPGGPITGLAALATAAAVGELVVLRPRHRGSIPLAYAFMLVLIRSFPAAECLAAIAIAEVVVVPLRGDATVAARARRSFEHAGAGLAGLAVYLVLHPLELLTPTPWILTVLAAASVTMLVVHELPAFLRSNRLPPIGGADLALIASGMLMAIGFRAVEGHKSVGLWGVALFSIPLLAAWYSFERLAVISRTSAQTIEALSLVPEMAGLARTGHAARVAEVSERVGDALGLRRRELDDLRAAALLHHLGHLCLDAPEMREVPIEPHEVADTGAQILRQTDLAAAGDILATDTVSLGGQILKVVSAYDDLAGVDGMASDAAIDALYSGPGFLYDPRVLVALERVVASA